MRTVDKGFFASLFTPRRVIDHQVFGRVIGCCEIDVPGAAPANFRGLRNMQRREFTRACSQT